MGGFEYFHGTTAEQFQFYMIPQLLFTDDRFKKISCDAKVLYSLLLDRTGLSFRNPDKFVDENNRTFIYFTRDTVMEMLNCGKEKSASMFQELEKIGLIERKVQGLGKPTKIYVKDFSKPIENTQKGNNLQEVGKADLLKSEKPTSVSRESRPLKVGKTDPNHTNSNQTDINHTDINQTNQTAAEAADRTTDKKTNKKSFKDILTEIGYQFPNIPREDFASGFDEQDVDILKRCQIPEHYSSNKEALKTALEFFTEYDYAYNGFLNQSDRILYKQIVDCINDISSNTVNAINKKIQLHGELYSWIIMVMDEWKAIVSKNKISKPIPYMRKCISNWLNSTELEFKASSDEYATVQQTEKEDTSFLSSDYLNMLMNSTPKL